MIIKNINSLNFTGIENLGQSSFFIGTFLLGSALPLSIIFYLISIFFVFINKKVDFYKDKYNRLLLISSGIMIFSNINSTINIKEFNSDDILNIWINLFNWLPLFLLFYCSTFYLNSISKRKLFSKFLIAGTIPILISCILEQWFNVNGTFKTLNGIIIWYLDKVDYSDISISGLFSNRNYTGLWLSCILIFSIYELITVRNILFNKLFLITSNFLIIYFTFYTFSRNAIIGLFITFILLFNKLKLIIPIISGYIIINLMLFIFPSFNLLIPLNFKRFFILNIENFMNFNRIEIFSIASNLIVKNPLLGWGASTFPKMYKISGGVQSVQHSHNMILELAYNYGIILSILLTGFVSVLLFKGFQAVHNKHTFKSKLFIDKCWLISSIVVTVSHLSDITYNDGKIGILIWILLSGVKCIIEEKHSKLKNEEVIYN